MRKCDFKCTSFHSISHSLLARFSFDWIKLMGVIWLRKICASTATSQSPRSIQPGREKRMDWWVSTWDHAHFDTCTVQRLILQKKNRNKYEKLSWSSVLEHVQFTRVNEKNEKQTNQDFSRCFLFFSKRDSIRSAKLQTERHIRFIIFISSLTLGWWLGCIFRKRAREANKQKHTHTKWNTSTLTHSFRDLLLLQCTCCPMPLQNIVNALKINEESAFANRSLVVRETTLTRWYKTKWRRKLFIIHFRLFFFSPHKE